MFEYWVASTWQHNTFADHLINLKTYWYDSLVIKVSSRSKMTGIVGVKSFLRVLRRRPIDLTESQTYPIMPDMTDMKKSNID
ncbi:UNVERIFIED_CONTAM: hypothetical protein NCL1_24968 [Trichonephila clavipes]